MNSGSFHAKGFIRGFEHSGKRLAFRKRNMSYSDDMPLSSLVFEEDMPFARLLESDFEQTRDEIGPAEVESVANFLNANELCGASDDEVQVSDSDVDYETSPDDDSSDEDQPGSTSRKRRCPLQSLRNYVSCMSAPGSSGICDARTALSVSLDSTVELQSADDDAISTASTNSGAPSASRPVQAGKPVVRLSRSMNGRDGWMWSVNPIGHQAVRRSIHNIVRGNPGPTLPVNFSGSSL